MENQVEARVQQVSVAEPVAFSDELSEGVSEYAAVHGCVCEYP